jgi:hypothetical protein
MYGTYLRLGISVHASWRCVIRAAALKLKPSVRLDRTHRDARHRFYREMLAYHRNDNDLVRRWRLSRTTSRSILPPGLRAGLVCFERRPSMSAQFIYDHAPLGAIIRFSDRTPEPPVRFKRKHAAWEDRNGCGRLIAKSPPRETGSYRSEPAITLHLGDYGTGSVVVLIVQRTFGLGCPLDFAIEALPAPGSVLVLHDWAGKSELLHLASDNAAAGRWLTKNRYSNLRLEDVGASEIPVARETAP